MDQASIIRLVSERELLTSKTMTLEADGWSIVFNLATITAENKRVVRREYDAQFPVPPVVSIKTPVGNVARFDLEDKEYQRALDTWHDSLSYAVLGATIGMSIEDIHKLERMLPNDFMVQLFTTAELINGIQSEPLADLLKEAIWAPEVLTWIETYKPKGGEITISDKPMYRQIEAMVAAGMKFSDWDAATPRERLLIMNWYDYRQLREAYVNWWHTSRNESQQAQNPMRAMLPR